MKCVNHPAIDSVGFCGQCGRPVCSECRREVRGMVYCEACIAARLQGPSVPGMSGPDTGPSPGVALALGFIPGVGAIYNGQVVKAMVQVLIFGSLIALADRVGGPFEPLFGLGAAAFYFYMVIDSYQSAKAICYGAGRREWLGLSELKMGAPVGAALLIGLGVLFLLDNLGLSVFHHVGKFWPVLLIVVGVILLQRQMGEMRATPPPSASHPAVSGPSGSKTPDEEGPSNIPGPRGL